MVEVLFWEKPGCASNAKQKRWLRASGHCVIERNLLTEKWETETLRAFFVGLPVALWFNPSAPAIKQGRVLPDAVDPATAIALMRGDPLLIRRPLLQVENQRRAGFNADDIAAWIGLNGATDLAIDVEDCRFASHEPSHGGACR